MQKIVILVALIFLSHSGFACSCFDTTKERVNDMCEYYDVIFTCTVIKGDNWNRFVVEDMNKDQSGSDVLIKIDSVIKGDIETDQILFIYQSSGGSCTENFKYNSKNLVFGRILKGLSFQSHAPSSRSIQPSPLGLKKDGTLDVQENEDLAEFLKCKLEQYTVVDTNMCGTFNYGSSTYRKIISFLSY